MRQQQLEMLKDLHLVEQKGSAGISVRRGEKRKYLRLESDGLVYFVGGFGRGDNYSIRLTDKGREYVAFKFAYRYPDTPHEGQVAYQDQNGNITLVC